MDVVAVSTVAGSAVVVVGAAVAVIRNSRRVSREIAQWREDWYGQAARPGFAAVPGIPERLQRIEAQVTSNGGSSMRDQLGRVELNQSRQAVDMGIVARRLDDHLREVGPAFAELTAIRRSQPTVLPAGEAATNLRQE